MFERPHHQRIAHVLGAINGPLLRQHSAWFGGGTCIALRYGEYRESVDIDFLVSDATGYRDLRNLLTGPQGLNAIVHPHAQPMAGSQDVRADQYGMRAQVPIDGHTIKFEIVREARLALDTPGPTDVICGIATLTPLDLAASTLLANSDRHADDGVFSRDLIDLGMMNMKLPLLRQALTKAEQAYGVAVTRDLGNAIDRLQNRPDWLERCMQAMAISTVPKAVLWQKVRRLRQILPTGQRESAASTGEI